MTGIMAEKTNSVVIPKEIKQAKCRYRDKVESQFNGSDTICYMLQGLQAITDYKKKTSYITDTDVFQTN